MTPDTYRRLRWAVLGLSVALCVMAYLRVVPLAFGMAAACLIPLVWTVDAYRNENRLMFALSAGLLLLTALPLLRLARTTF